MNRPTKTFSLEKLTNAEMYYIISNLMDLGALREDMIESEKLFVSFDSHYERVDEIKFFFMSMLPVISDSMEEPQTSFTIGKITRDFEIEVTSGNVPMSVLDPNKDEFDAQKIIQLERLSTQMYSPLRIVKGISSIVDNNQFAERANNDLFQSTWSHIDESLAKYFDFGRIGDTDYSGRYFMIVKPCEDEDYANSIIDYILIQKEEYDKIQTYSWKLRAQMIQEYEKSGIDCFSHPETDIAKRLFISLGDCSEMKAKELISDMTESEFVSSRVCVYTSEYKTAVKAGYDELGAHEIAFQEAFSDLN